MSEHGSKRKKSNYHVQRKRKLFVLEPGLRGFLCFCNFREKDCIRESYNLLNEYANKLSKKTIPDEPLSTENVEDILSDTDDIEDTLSKEIDAVKNNILQLKRFQVVESGAKNVIFIRTTEENPVQLVNAIIQDILETKQQKTRYLLRLLPIEYTCKANLTDMKECAVKLVDQYFSDEPKSFAVIYNHRNNSNLSKDEIIKEIAALVGSKNDKHFVNLKNPSLAVLVEVIRGMCLMSVVSDYMKNKKFNLLQLCECSVEVNLNMEEKNKN